MRPLRVAAAQAAARGGEIEANCHTAARLTRGAARSGAALVVFPELFLCGYDLDRIRDDPAACDLQPEDARLGPLTTACRETRTHVVVGASVREPDGRRLAALIIDAHGDLRGRYDKRHLWGPEQNLFTPGQAACTLHLVGWTLALGICVEAEFPDHARAAARDGAHAYLSPSALGHDAPIVHASRAHENAMYTVLANHIGPGFRGNSAIFDPTGACIAQLSATEEGFALTEFEPSAVARRRRAA